TFHHLLADYFRGVSEVGDDHYVELLEHVQPEVFATRESLLQALARARQRREHVHVWDSTSCKSFLEKTFGLLGQEGKSLYESSGSENHFEYFAVLHKLPPAENRREISLHALSTVYRARPDLQQAFPLTHEQFPLSLLEWAVTAGATIDSDAAVLASYQAAYRDLVDHLRREPHGQKEVRRLVLSSL
ncbi:MAG: hypothetical protein ACRERD_09145, partial [Candidatus Binatia bacterium]